MIDSQEPENPYTSSDREITGSRRRGGPLLSAILATNVLAGVATLLGDSATHSVGHDSPIAVALTLIFLLFILTGISGLAVAWYYVSHGIRVSVFAIIWIVLVIFPLGWFFFNFFIFMAT